MNQQNYITEFTDENKHISFNKLVDTLANSYIETKLNSDTKKNLKEEIEKEFRMVYQESCVNEF